MKFFFDRNISVHIARMMDHFDRENDVVHQDDDARFVATDEDEMIIRTVGGESPKPVWVTADLGQRREPEERLALRESQMCVVFFRGGFHQLTPHHQAIKVLTVWPAIVRECRLCKAPAAFEVSSPISSTKLDRLGTITDFFR